MATETSSSKGFEPLETVDSITLLDGENAYKEIRPSLVGWIASNPKLHVALLLLTLGLWVIVGFIWKMSAIYVITDQRVYRRVGILSKRTDEYRYGDIQQFTTGKSLFERLAGVGNLQFQTGTGGEAITFWGVPDNDEVANIIRAQLQKQD